MANDAFKLARALGATGLSAGEIAERLRASPAGFRSQEIARASKFGETWGTRIRGFQTTDTGKPIPRAWMMRNQSLDSAYRFTVTFVIRDALGGIAGYNTIIIESAVNLNLEEMQALAESTYGEIATYYERFRTMPLGDFTEMEILNAERRSG